MVSELNNFDMDEAAKLFEDNSKKDGLKSAAKSTDSTRKNRSKSPTTTKNKRNKKSEGKKKKKKTKTDDKDNSEMDLDKSVDKEKNEEEKNTEEETKDESIENKDNEKPQKNENNDKKNKKKKKSDIKEEEEPEVTQNDKKDKKKGKAKKKKTSEGAGESMDTTQVTKNDAKSKTRGKSKDKSKVKKKEENTKIDDPKQYVYDYMKAQNRPYSLQNIFDNLHGSIKKGQLGKILDSLVDEGSLIMKEYNSKIYLFNQDKLEIKVSDSDINELQKEIDEKREENKQLKDEISSNNNELKLLTTTLTDDELKAKIKEMKKELAKMKLKVDDIKDNKIDPIPPEKMNEAKENFEKELKIYKKTKKICSEIISDISDGLELKLKDTYEKIGIENDDDLLKQLNIDQNLINGK